MPECEEALPGWGPLLAFALLTIVPAGKQASAVRPDLSRTAVYFPIVGAVVGAVGAGIAWGASQVLPRPLAATAAVLVMVLLTGAIHLDGLADTADGYGGRTREGALEIMHDHSLGTYGVIALVADLGIRVFAVSTLLAPARDLLVLVAVGAISRAAIAAMSTLLPYVGASQEGKNLGALVARGTRLRLAASLVLTLVLSGLALGIYFTAVLSAVGAAVAVVWIWYSSSRLGGFTGDLLGAVSELVEVACLIAAVGYLAH